ncbi:hypothetical protein QYE76_051187 [Lolium multiflorum]|uniref:Aminotransferase-like plant mobile domain-containing protein n=1 Tax=Lolium multiflorum TaxID=4521 RepID=A0AAD8SRF1_LOLMU|nr:hypothetical protein QYE76_051187 [Lolium multiflorum]
MNPSAITALIDRWRPETHSFHLRTGEMTVTLQDMSMILALPIEGKPLCIDTSCENWRGKMFDLIGKAPDEIINKRGEKLRVSAGATFTWISQNFKTCPERASRDVIKLYARVYVWSASPSDQDDANNSKSTARDEEVSDEAEGEPEVDEDDEEVPLGKYVKNKRSAYKLKPRKERQDRYTPDAYAKAPAARKARKKAVIESDEEEHTEPHQKIPPRRGGKTKRARN